MAIPPPPPPPPPCIAAVVVFLIIFPEMIKAYMTDSDALLKIKKSLNNPQPLDSWKLGTKPCDEVVTWVGLVCTNGLVSNIHLRSMSLSGDLDFTALSQMVGLRIISIENNSFSGPIPEFNRLGSLKALYISLNQFSGEIPAGFFSEMTSLKKIWFDGNKFTGKIPSSIGELPNLVELHLEDNQFSGKIPAIGQRSLESVNLSYNNLTGEVPPGLARFDAASFEGNPGLCGAKFGTVCGDPIPKKPKPIEKQTSKSTRIEYALMAVTLLILMLMIIGIYVLMKKKKKKDNSEANGVMEKDNIEGSVGLTICSISKPSAIPGQSSFGTGQTALISKNKAQVDFMMLNHKKGRFGLADVMKAAAEVLGNGMLGSSYKAMMSNGMTVVVKRLKQMNMVDKDGFEAEMTRLGRLDHPNVLTPLACHYRKQEKLLIYEYIPSGSLLYLLHGERGENHSELNWHARLKIIQGIAQGIGYIHTELAILELPHGNLKSSNVLMGPDYQPLVVDFGLHRMINTNHVANALAGYKAPEAMQSRQVSPKCDVYCLGIIILEVVTGKFPCQYMNNGQGGTDVVQWVRSAIQEHKEGELLDPDMAGSSRYVGEMIKVLHIGAACTESDPGARLDIQEVICSLENIQGGDESRISMFPSFGDKYGDAASTISESSYKSWGGESKDGRNDSFGYHGS